MASPRNVSQNYEDFVAKEYARLKLNFGKAVDEFLDKTHSPDKAPAQSEIDAAMNHIFLNNTSVQNQLTKFLAIVNDALKAYQIPRGDAPALSETLRAGNQAQKQYKDTGYRPKDGMVSPGIGQPQDNPELSVNNPNAENRNELKLGLYAKFKMDAPKLKAAFENKLKQEYQYTPRVRPKGPGE